jgi:hypothetical protein
MMPPISDVWIDCVAVFGKPPVPERARVFTQCRQATRLLQPAVTF